MQTTNLAILKLKTSSTNFSLLTWNASPVTHQSCDLMPARKENQDLSSWKAIPPSGQRIQRRFPLPSGHLEVTYGTSSCLIGTRGKLLDQPRLSCLYFVCWTPCVWLVETINQLRLGGPVGHFSRVVEYVTCLFHATHDRVESSARKDIDKVAEMLFQYNMTLHHLYNANEWLSTVCFGCVSHPLSLPFLLIDQSVCTESTVVTRSGYTHMCCLFQCVRFSMCVCNIYIYSII